MASAPAALMPQHCSKLFAQAEITLAVTRTQKQVPRVNLPDRSVNLMVQMFGKNGGIDIDGFVGLFKYIQAIRTSFETLDKNKSGSLSADEIKHAITKANFVFKNQQTFDAIFNRHAYLLLSIAH